jgi:hypothetical protein
VVISSILVLLMALSIIPERGSVTKLSFWRS